MTTTQAPGNLITIKLDGQEVQGPNGATILEMARENSVYIPTLCWDPRLKAYGACRMCLVQTEGRPGFPASCVTPAAPNASYLTNSADVVKMRQGILGMLMAEHPHGCLTCDRITHCGPGDICLRNVSVTDRCVVCPQNQRCELQATVEINGVDQSVYEYHYRQLPIRLEDPYIDRDYNLCIACARCVRICDEVIGAEAISMVDRGDRVLPGTPFDVPLSDSLSGCIFCGACVDACPVGALTEKENKWAGLPEYVIPTVCDQCEIGCQVNVEMKDGRLLRVTPDVDGGANGGLACIKGKFQLADPSRREDRALAPQVRKNGSLEEASWDEAIEAIGEALQQTGGEASAVISTGTLSNEDAYLLQRFAREVLGSRSIDSLPRAVSPAIGEMERAFGSSASTNPVSDLAGAKAVLVLGVDLERTHPVAAYQIHKAANYQDAEVIVVSAGDAPEMARTATQRLRINRGMELELLRGMLKVVVDEGLVDEEYVEERTEGVTELRRSLESVTIGAVAQRTGVSVEALRQAARTYATTKPAAIAYGVDTAADSRGIAAALADLALLTGNVGKPSTGLYAFRPDGNAQGVQDMGLAPREGERDLYGVLEGIERGEIKSLLWFGDLPLERSWLPESLQSRQEQRLPAGLRERLIKALQQVDFLAVMGLAPRELAQYASVVLPAAPFVERGGTYTNVERRVQRLRASFPAKGQSRPYWQAVMDLAEDMGGRGFAYESEEDIFAELVGVTPAYTGLTYAALDAEAIGLMTSVQGVHLGQPTGYLIRQMEGFATESGKGQLAVV